jgi:hypothetical protein
MAEFDRFDICEAWYIYAMEYHGGQDSRLYKVFGQLSHIGFRLSPMINDEDDLEENAREIYEDLVARKARQ